MREGQEKAAPISNVENRQHRSGTLGEQHSIGHRDESQEKRSLLSSPNETTQRSQTKSTLAMSVVFVTVGFERAAYYSLLGDLASFLNTQLEWPPTLTAVAVLLFSGMSWISCFIGGVLGDSNFGRYNTISLGLVLYVFGFVSLPLIADFKQILAAYDGDDIFIVLWLSCTLILVSVGEGFFKSNISPFGADQVYKSNPKQLHRFFSVFYLFINIGSLFGFGPVIYVEEDSFLDGYLASVACISISAIIFMIPRSCLYQCTTKLVPHNVVKRTWQIAREAWKKRNSQDSSTGPSRSDFEKLVPIHHWLDRASVRYGGSYPDMEVNEVKTLCEIFPPFAFLIVYYILYYQISGTFLLQGIHMNTSIHGFSIPAAWLSLMNVIFVLLFIPVVDYIVYPCLQYCGFYIDQLKRISFGMILGSLSLICAALVETRRLSTNRFINNTISGTEVNATDLEIWYQIPQYAISGISEVFVSVTGLEYAYTQAPKSMQSIVTGLFFVSNGLGSFIGSLLLGIADACGLEILKRGSGRYPSMGGHLHYFFYALSAINAFTWLFFVRYIYKKSKRKKTDWKSRRNSLHKFLQKTNTRTRSRYGSTLYSS